MSITPNILFHQKIFSLFNQIRLRLIKAKFSIKKKPVPKGRSSCPLLEHILLFKKCIQIFLSGSKGSGTSGRILAVRKT